MKAKKVVESKYKKVQDRKASQRYQRRKEKIAAQAKRAERLQRLHGTEPSGQRESLFSKIKKLFLSF